MNYKYSTLALAIVALLTGCGAEDNKDISGDNNNIYPPIIKGDVTIPALHVGRIAKGAYQYFDPNPTARPEGESLYSWRDANETELGTEQSLALTYEMLGENLKFCVKPVAQGSNRDSDVGDEECSDPRIVQEALGEKPLADNVVLDNTAPTVGDTLTGTYDYSHSEFDEGNSLFTWYAGSSVIPGASTKTLVLLPDQTEGKAVKFCVTPATNESIPVRGDETCSDATDAVLVKDGSAPVAENTAITGDAFVGATLTGSYDYKDEDGDKEGASTIVWKREGTEIADATTNTYLAVGADENKDLTFCVTPVSATGNPTIGAEDCSAPLHITKKVEDAPVAANVAANVQSGGTAEPGEVLVGSYEFQHAEASEGATVGVWKVAGVDQPQCDTAQACEYPITQADIGVTISFCVTPYTALGTPGTKACSGDVTPRGIKLSGVLEYDKQVTAEVIGYDGYTKPRWMVDVSNQDGPGGDLSKTEQGTGLAYTIGTRASVTADSNGNGVIDDYDWIDGGGSTYKDARDFVGKSLEFCIDTAAAEEKCVSASDYAAVTGGLYFDAADKTKRAIEPIRQVTFGNFVYHRPLTAAEAALKADAGFGANIPDTSEKLNVNGIEWARFAQIVDGNNIALNSCRNLYADNGDWHLPISQFSAGKYVPNFYAADGNTPPTGSADSMIKLTKGLITDKNDTAYGISPVYGWPIGGEAKIPYGSASRLAASTQNYNVVRFYSNGSSANNYTETQAPLITCVKP